MGVIVAFFPGSGYLGRKVLSVEVAPVPTTRAARAAHATGPSPTESSLWARIGQREDSPTPGWRESSVLPFVT